MAEWGQTLQGAVREVLPEMPARSLKDGATWNQGVQAQVTASSSPDAEWQGDQMSGMSTHKGSL